MHLVKENELTLEKKHLLLDFPYLGIIYLRTRTKPQQALKVALNYCKIEIAFECQTGLSNSFCYKEHIPKDLIPKDLRPYTIFLRSICCRTLVGADLF